MWSEREILDELIAIRRERGLRVSDVARELHVTAAEAAIAAVCPPTIKWNGAVVIVNAIFELPDKYGEQMEKALEEGDYSWIMELLVGHACLADAGIDRG